MFLLIVSLNRCSILPSHEEIKLRNRRFPYRAEKIKQKCSFKINIVFKIKC